MLARARWLASARHDDYHSSRYCGAEIGRHHQPQAAVKGKSAISQLRVYKSNGCLPTQESLGPIVTCLSKGRRDPGMRAVIVSRGDLASRAPPTRFPIDVAREVLRPIHLQGSPVCVVVAGSLGGPVSTDNGRSERITKWIRIVRQRRRRSPGGLLEPLRRRPVRAGYQLA